MLDSAKVSGGEAHFRVRVTEFSRRTPASAFATVSWVHDIQLKLGTTSIAGLSRWFHGDKEGAKAFRRRQWAERRRGIHGPSATLVDAVEARCPNTADVLRHPLWRCLMPSADVPSLVRAVIPALPTCDGAVLTRALPEFGRSHRPTPGRIDRLAAIRQASYNLRLRGDLSALTCQLLLLRLAIAHKVAALGGLAKDVQISLLELVPWLWAHGVHVPLVKHIFAEFLHYPLIRAEYVRLRQHVALIRSCDDIPGPGNGEQLSASSADRWAEWVEMVSKEYRWERGSKVADIVLPHVAWYRSDTQRDLGGRPHCS